MKAGKRRAKGSRLQKEARPTTRNMRLTAQTRKVLGKHYASKYRVRAR